MSKGRAADRRQNLLARFAALSGIGLSREDTLLALLTVSLFLHWILACAVIFFTAVHVAFFEKSIFKDLSRRTSSLFLFALLALFSLFGLCIGNVISALFFLAIAIVAFVAFWLRSCMSLRRFERFLDISVFMGFYCAVYGIVDAYLFHASDADYLMQSSMNNANYYGLLLVFLILTALYRLEETLWQSRVGFYLGSIFVNFIMLLLTESVASLFGLVLGLLCLLVFYRHYRVFAASVFGLSSLLFGWAYFADAAFEARLIYPIMERVELWKIGYRSFESSLQNTFFGQGLFSYQGIWDSSSHNFWDVRGVVPRDFQPHCHNLYLEVLISVGIIGFFLLAAYGAVQVFSLYRMSRVHSLRSHTCFLLVLMATVFFAGLADVSIFWMQSGTWFLLASAASGIGAGEHVG
ncbi:MAG: O-antigen ligase family protein [Clostridia bacterium]|nr:O-antigen ligase family protein [Clostridia bacterium]